MEIEFGLLGPLSIVRDGVHVRSLSSKQRVVLATLLVRAEPGYRFVARPETLDANRFERLLAEGRMRSLISSSAFRRQSGHPGLAG